MAKKKQNKRDILKLTVVTLLVVVLVADLYIFRNQGNPLNTLSSVLTNIGFFLITPLCVVVVLFWILMLMESFKKKQWVWLLFIVLGPGVVALIYYFIKKPKFATRTLRTLAWTAIISFVIVWSPNAYASIKNQPYEIDFTKLQPTGREFDARVVTEDLRGFKYEGKTTCREMKHDNKYYLEVSGGKILISQDSPSVHINYKLSTDNNDSNTELGGGWQSSEQPLLSKQEIAIVDLIGGPSEINHDVTGCRIELWTSSD